MTKMHERIKAFLRKYQIKTLDDNKRAAVSVHVPENYDCSAELSKYLDQTYGALYTVEIPEYVLLKLSLQDENYTKFGGSALTMLDYLINQSDYEQHIRDNNESVRVAYEQYQLLLSLACKGKSP